MAKTVSYGCADVGRYRAQAAISAYDMTLLDGTAPFGETYFENRDLISSHIGE
jgi:hypothetical protein